MALRTAAAAKSETDANKPSNTSIVNSLTVSDIDAEILKKGGAYYFTLDMTFEGKDENGVVSIEQSDRTFINLDDLLSYIGEQGYIYSHEVYSKSSGLIIKIKMGWNNG